MIQFALVLVAAIVVGLIVLYNRLISMRRLMENAWADMDVFLKRRADLIPNLVAAVKGASDFEQSTLARLVEARQGISQASGATPERQQTEASITSGLSRVTMIAESYPDLKASANFLDLQRQLSETEKLIASSRQYYNACVRDYNVLIESFPSNLVASFAKLTPRDFFEIDTPSERSAPTVGL
ncbi:MAG: LemA family protein [Fimbriimonas sp.]